MTRREAFKHFTILMSAGFSIATFGTAGCQTADDQVQDAEFSNEHQKVIDEIADTIIPDTDTPGAKKAGVGPFIVMMMNDCYPESTRKVFIDGIDKVQERSRSKYNTSFDLISLKDRESLLKEMEDEGVNNNDMPESQTKRVSPEFFKLVRELTLLGYFTSEIGATQALNYVSTPENYNECTTLEPGQKAWAI